MSEKEPQIIYLQVTGGSYEGEDCVTWCTDKINDNDITYIHHNVVELLRAEIARLTAQLNTAADVEGMYRAEVAGLREQIETYRRNYDVAVAVDARRLASEFMKPAIGEWRKKVEKLTAELAAAREALQLVVDYCRGDRETFCAKYPDLMGLPNNGAIYHAVWGAAAKALLPEPPGGEE